MVVTSRTITKAAATPVRRKRTISDTFNEWLTLRDRVALINERVSTLHDRLMTGCERHGQKDEKGSQLLPLAEPVEFKTHDGKVKIYTGLKRERYMTPAEPTPDSEKAERLLRRLKLWMSVADRKLLQELRIRNPYVVITVEIDTEAVAMANLKGLISDDDYDAILIQQEERFRFKPAQ